MKIRLMNKLVYDLSLVVTLQNKIPQTIFLSLNQIIFFFVLLFSVFSIFCQEMAGEVFFGKGSGILYKLKYCL